MNMKIESVSQLEALTSEGLVSVNVRLNYGLHVTKDVYRVGGKWYIVHDYHEECTPTLDGTLIGVAIAAGSLYLD